MEQDGIVRMMPAEAVEVAPGKSVVLRPGGLHFMTMGLKRKPAKGGRVRLTLTFRRAGSIALNAPVARAGARSAPKHSN